MKIYLGSVKWQMTIALFLIFLTAVFHNFSAKSIVFLLLTIIAAVGSDILFIKIRRLPVFAPTAAIVSSLIIVLLADPNSIWYKLIIISVLAMFSKNFLRIGNRHIFNPAAFGLFAGSVLFQNVITWWGVSWQQFTINNSQLTISYLILLSPILISVLKMKRHRIIISFLITYSLPITILNTQYLILNTIFDPTIIFYSLVMLPEPMTSPNNHRRQIIFGITVAAISLILSLSTLNAFDSLILSLLLGNLLFFKLR